jgi:hypothetical protein
MFDVPHTGTTEAASRSFNDDYIDYLFNFPAANIKASIAKLLQGAIAVWQSLLY